MVSGFTLPADSASQRSAMDVKVGMEGICADIRFIVLLSNRDSGGLGKGYYGRPASRPNSSVSCLQNPVNCSAGGNSPAVLFKVLGAIRIEGNNHVE